MKKQDKKIANDFLDALTNKIKVTRVKHKGYLEWEKYQATMNDREYLKHLPKELREGYYAKMKKSHFGKYQYLYENTNGIMSLIRLSTSLVNGSYFWEIYSLGGSIKYEFKNTKVFHSKKQAEKVICKLLDGEL